MINLLPAARHYSPVHVKQLRIVTEDSEAVGGRLLAGRKNFPDNALENLEISASFPCSPCWEVGGFCKNLKMYFELILCNYLELICIT